MGSNPPLQGGSLLATQLELVSTTTTGGTLYGIAFCLYCLYLHASLPRLREHDRRRQAQFMMSYSSIIMLCGLCNLILNTWINQDAYIKHANFPGGPLAYQKTTYLTQPAGIAVVLVCVLVIDILTAAIQIWRLWVIWSGTRYGRFVAILPSLCLAVFTALRIKTIYFNLTLTRANGNLFRQEARSQNASYALQATITILSTVLIAGFLIVQRWRQKKLLGKSQVLSTPYLSVIAMLVESYAMDSIWAIIIGVLNSLNHPAIQFFGNTQPYIEIIAYLLVLYRVANGRAYGSQRAHEPQSERNNISSLHWNHTTTTESDDITSGTDIHPTGNKSEPDISQVQGSPA
ncbi:hypothetical protein AGABI2DRAFT_120914 [Agaricus bisporus var. bisporus H97]|uniref:hypothetical protein n=1 Tax=Agaricus bisporus var. bisporus (strain H97 / ATCC MYA-4626 / FGSC 10389) TaxID=936046 RepID=UPI00029F54FC|nr:hypothetical protein AGABI2DRAFT_120914 [Agaricus bisporus var. bisporus H97]EKV44818.1 hypothetical protein AGABI2DRAFT_120914 [Agaricus bisporus var. bisporus H97]